MKVLDLAALRYSFDDIYNLRDEESKGRLISLGSAVATAVYNVFITGIFYTGFLSMYGMSITGVGIVSFIPYIANCFSVFSPAVLSRFKKRKGVMLASKIYFYAMYIIATNLMPQFVTDPDDRLKWFVVILFLAYSVYALFSPGITTWFYRFYPQESDRRTRYIVMNQTFSSVLSSSVLLLSGILTDAVEGTPLQNQIILGFRYFAFVLVLLDVAMQAMAKEYPYPETPKLKLKQIFTEPLKHRKFLLCMILMFVWNYIANLNNGLWNYHLLNHLNFSYTVINTISMMYTIILLCTSNLWQKILRRYSWIKTFGLAVLFFMPTEFAMFSLKPGMQGLYVVTALIQQFFNVGLNFSYANILYMNLPEQDSTAHISFNTIGCNLCAFLGMITGTYVSGISSDELMGFLGMEIWSVQLTTLMRAIGLAAVGILLIVFWKKMTPDHEIEDIVKQDELAKWHRQHRAEQWKKQLHSK